MRARAKRAAQVAKSTPSTNNEWSVRIATIAAVLVLAGAFLLMQRMASMSSDLNEVRTELGIARSELGSNATFMTQSREQRTAFQAEETARQCAILAALDVSTQGLKCGP